MDLSVTVDNQNTPQPREGSARVGAVWGKDVQRKSPDAAGPAYRSPSVVNAIENDLRPVRDSPRKSPVNPALFMNKTAITVLRNMSNPKLPAVNNLLVHTRNILEARLTPGAKPVDCDDTVALVVEPIINGVINEYEKRLQAKDSDLQLAATTIANLNREQKALCADLASIKRDWDETKQVAVEAATQTLVQQVNCLQDQLEAARARLEAGAEELEAAQRLIGSQDVHCNVAASEAMAKCEELQNRLQVLEGMDQRCAKLREENRELYNKIQDLKGSIRVFCRVRPLGATGDKANSCLDMGMEGDLALYDKGERKMFRFDRVFGDNSTQADIYADVQPLVRSVLDGYNVCIFAYGQTGSGKTHTMTGTSVEDMDGRGINYRALDDLFALRNQRSSDVDYDIKVQMLEIYNESLRDLLVENQSASNKLDLLATQPSGQNVPGAMQVVVDSTDRVLEVMRLGAKNRHSAATNMNERSSRSHQVLTVIVNGINKHDGSRSSACMHLVDLAGSERVKKSGAEGDRLDEAAAINTSLTALGTVLNSLAIKSRHVPFRDSKLTQMLADSLSGQAKVLMFMHIAPESSSAAETFSTLNFGNRVASVTLGQAKCNVESGKVFQAHEEMSTLKGRLEKLEDDVRGWQEAHRNAMRHNMEQAAIIQSLRAQLAQLQGDAPPLSARTESHRSVHTLGDACALTPMSGVRQSRPSGATPRNHAVYATTSQASDVSRTPRSSMMRTPGPALPLGSITRAAASSATPRGTSARPQPTPEDRPLQSARGSRDPPGPRTSGIPTSSVSGSRPATAKPDTQSGSLSARPSARYGSSGGVVPLAQTLTRPATSRAGGTYGAAGAGPLASTRPPSVILEAPTSKATRPPVSARGGWH